MANSIKLGPQHRMATIERRADSQESRTVELAFSSEEPYARWWGVEVLGHGDNEVDMNWMKSGRAPLLLNHEPEDQIGIVEKAYIGPDRVARAVVRFGKGVKADEVFNDVMDGIRCNVSVGYEIRAMRLEEESDGLATYRVTDWRPFEVSIVSVPADTTVGVGREAEDGAKEIPIQPHERSKAMPAETTTTTEQPKAVAAPAVKREEVEQSIRKRELDRINDITAMGQQHKLDQAMVNKAISEGTSSDDFARSVLDHLSKERPNVVRAAESAEIGMSQSDIQRFSIVRAINALANPQDRRVQEMAAFEFEASAAAGQRMGMTPKGIMVPMDVLTSRAALNVGTASAGGNLVATELMAGSFIELLRKKSALAQLGSFILSGLNGNLAIPKQTGGASAYWVSAEGGDATESAPTFGQVPLSPKTMGAFTDLTRQLLLQASTDVEGLVRNDLIKALALELSRAGLYGSNANGQPKGVSLQTGINTTTFAAANPTYEEVVAMESAVAADDADVGSLGYAVNTAMRGHFKTTVKFANTGMTIWEQGNTVNGYACAVSNQVVAGDAFFGNFADLIIGMWGGLDLTVDPYSNSKSGTVRVVALQSIDVAVRHPESFCFSNDGV